MNVIKVLLYFHLITLMSREVGKKKLNITQNVMSNTLAGVAVRAAQNVWHALTKSCLLRPLSDVTQP